MSWISGDEKKTKEINCRGPCEGLAEEVAVISITLCRLSERINWPVMKALK